MVNKTYFNWSSGKDSALALYYLLRGGQYQVSKLLTTVNSHYNRVSMHGLSVDVLKAQAKSIGIELDLLKVPKNPSMEEYNQLMTQKVTELKKEGFTYCVFGDIFLQDLRKYREEQLLPTSMAPVFPIWNRNTTELIQEFLDLGFRTIIVCINNNLLDKSFLGAEITPELIERLPVNVDPCGENGEFHTFCFAGPIFKKPLHIKLGEKVFKTYDAPSGNVDHIKFGFCEVLLD